MIPRTLLTLAACAFLSACSPGPGEDTGGPAATATPEAAEETHAESDADVVHIEAGMLRDLRITVDEVESRQGGEQLSLLGELAVDERHYAEVGAPVQARVLQLLVTAGESVKSGDAVAELTSPELGQARAAFLSAQTRVALAEAALERKRSLAQERIAPLREVQEAELQVADARAALRASRAAIGAFGVEPPASDTVDATSSTFVLRSPVTGSVIERTAVLGQMLDPAVPAFRIGNLSTLWLTVHAFERDAVRIRTGTAARLAFPALPGQDFDGRVSMVGRHVESESRTVPVRIDVSNTNGLLRPGMSGTALLSVGMAGDPILSVPVAAVQRVRNDWCVFLPLDEGTFEIRRIGRGRDLAGEVEVLTGVRAGERIVVDGAFLLKAEAERGEAGHEH